MSKNRINNTNVDTATSNIYILEFCSLNKMENRSESNYDILNFFKKLHFLAPNQYLIRDIKMLRN